jgi:hypothetical protein
MAFNSEVVFKHSKERALLEPSNVSWAGEYSISPNERWILRTQKIGSGDNTVYLYEIRTGRLVSHDGYDLGAAAWDFFYKNYGGLNVGHYHTTTHLKHWVKGGDGVELILNGTSLNETKTPHVEEFVLMYDCEQKRSYISAESDAGQQNDIRDRLNTADYETDLARWTVVTAPDKTDRKAFLQFLRRANYS